MIRRLSLLFLLACGPSASTAKGGAEPPVTSTAPMASSAEPVASTAPSSAPSATPSTGPSATVAPTASTSTSSAPPGVMMLDDDLLKRVSKKGEIYVVTLKKQAAKKCAMSVLHSVVGGRKGDFEVACSMDLKPGDYVVAIEATGPSGKQITSAASVAPGQAEAAAKAHKDRIKSL